MLLMLDNYDSFTYNLVQYLQMLGAEVKVVRNDALTRGRDREARARAHRHLARPVHAERSRRVAGADRALGPHTPILGVCLGHQSIGQAYGGDVIRAKTIMHGKTSRIRHEGKGVFAGLPDAYEATRYHSLVVDRGTLAGLPGSHRLDRAEDGSFEEIMGLRHREFPVEGVQFHPESILTEHGHALLKNFLEK